MTTTIPWNVGGGNITLTYTGQGNGTVVVTSDDNTLDVQRSQVITVKTTDNSISRTVTIIQGAAPNFKDAGGNFIILADGNAMNVLS